VFVIKSNVNDKTYTFEGVNFYYCAHLGGFAAIVDESLTEDYIVSKLVVVDAPDADVVVNNGDIDGDTIITAGDAALISEMLHKVDAGDEANAVYTDAMRLGADVYADGDVTATDATAVLYKSVGLTFVPEKNN